MVVVMVFGVRAVAVAGVGDGCGGGHLKLLLPLGGVPMVRQAAAAVGAR